MNDKREPTCCDGRETRHVGTRRLFVPCAEPDAKVTDGTDRLFEEFDGHVSANFDCESEEDSGILEFSHVTCDGCRTRLAGGRHRFAVLARYANKVGTDG